MVTTGVKKGVKKALGHAFLRVMGWRPEGAPPADQRYVLIAAPHTTNWDLPLTLAFSFVYDVPIRWMGKHTLFEGPAGALMKRLGGVPVVRSERKNMVDQMVELFEENDTLVLAVPTEGTRSRVEFWKSGFYHIAREADVPIVLGFLDYSRRRGGFGPPVRPSGDVPADMDRIRDFYTDKIGKFPEKFGPVRLRQEAAEERAAAADRESH
jgi:1-acyl-sn-glycerol-3-phosphate acyltransferase